MFRGIISFVKWREHQPPHFHATYAGEEVIFGINDIEVLEGNMPYKQLKILLGWAAFHQEELMENRVLAEKHQELFQIDPMK